MKKSLWLLCVIVVNVQAVSVYDALQRYPEIEYQKCHDPIPFTYSPFPLAIAPQYHPYSGLFAETFVLTIPQGRVISRFGFVTIQNSVITELLPQNYTMQTYEKLLNQVNALRASLKKIPGRVAAITRIDTDCYGHWIGEILGRLALLELCGVEYDWLYVPYDRPYIKETLELWGIDSCKIIEPYNDTLSIEADELIVPSLTVRRIPSLYEETFTPWAPWTMYAPQWVIEYMRNKFLPLADQQRGAYDFSEKVFISRKDAYQRRMTNEDEVFALFEAQGFKRYCLGEMSFLEQVILFSGATAIVAAHGSALTNVIFCDPGTRIVEIYQQQFDSTFWQLSEQAGLVHDCIKTQERGTGSIKIDTEVPIGIIETYLNEHSFL